MLKRYFLLLLTVFFWVSVNAINSTQTAEKYCEDNGINHLQAQGFANKIRLLIETNDAKMLSESIAYPLIVEDRDKPTRTIKSKEDFVREFPLLFNSATRKMLNTDKELVCMPQGARFGSGIIVFHKDKVGREFLIDQIFPYSDTPKK